MRTLIQVADLCRVMPTVVVCEGVTIWSGVWRLQGLTAVAVIATLTSGKGRVSRITLPENAINDCRESLDQRGRLRRPVDQGDSDLAADG
jgi:hypothetical protein